MDKILQKWLLPISLSSTVHSCFSYLFHFTIHPAKGNSIVHLPLSVYYSSVLPIFTSSFSPSRSMAPILNLLAGLTSLASSFANPSSLVAQLNPASQNTTGNTPKTSQIASLPAGTTLQYGGLSANQFFSPAFIPKGQALIPTLSQQQTNGDSKLGTFDAPRLPHFITGGPQPSGFPWGPRTAKDTNFYQDVPNTGMTRRYDFTLSEMVIAPDGVEKKALVVNKQYPGPTIGTFLS